MIHELRHPIPMECPKGPGLAYLVIDYGIDHSLVWVIAIDATGECWSYPNEQIRFVKNATMGRRTDDGKCF